MMIVLSQWFLRILKYWHGFIKFILCAVDNLSFQNISFINILNCSRCSMRSFCSRFIYFILSQSLNDFDTMLFRCVRLEQSCLNSTVFRIFWKLKNAVADSIDLSIHSLIFYNVNYDLLSNLNALPNFRTFVMKLILVYNIYKKNCKTKKILQQKN